MHSSDLRIFFRYVIPSMITMFIGGLYNIIDSFFIGQAMGYEALAAINVTFPIFCLIFGMGDMISMGACILISQNRGAGNTQEENTVFSAMFGTAALASILLSALLLYYVNPILLWLGAEPELLSMAREYLVIILLGSILQIMAICFMAALRNDNHPVLAMWIISTGLIFNIFLDFILVWVLHWELFGAALATILAQMVPLTVSICFFSGNRTPLKFQIKKCIPDLHHIRIIIQNGFPSLGAHITIGAMLLFHNWQALRYGGIPGLAAYAVICETESVASMVMQGIASGMQPIASYFYGAQQHMRNRKILRYGISLALLLGTVGTLVSILGCHFFPSILGVKEEAAKIAARGLIISSPMFIALGLIKVGSHYFQATQRILPASILIHGDYALILPLCLFGLPLVFGLDGVWAAMPISRFILLGILIFCALFLRNTHR
ncbi:MAG: MATE family efflux transporter [Planctomycetia bacterium]|nr:MATE family efflux transporter [Planctomycetia bacterium]